VNYVQLRASIQEYAEDFEASFVDNIDVFIRLTENRIKELVRMPRFRKDAAATLTAGNNQLAVPTDFLAPDSLSVTTASGIVILLNKDPEFLTECYPDPSSTGVPRFYSLINERTIGLGPTPALAYPANMGYYYEPPSIVDSGTSWLGDHFAHSLLSGSLVEASKYQKAEDNIFARYDQAFDKDLQMDRDTFAKGRAKKDTYQEPDTRSEV